MKNFFNNVRKAGPLKTRDTFIVDQQMVDDFGSLTLIDLMEAMNEVKNARIQSLMLSDHYEECINNMDMTFFENAEVGDTLNIESCFVANGKKLVDLKIYVSKQTSGSPAKRVCRAVYTISVKRKQASLAS
ncbi:MAG: hypothetical protein RL754_1179 [Bacteroidota bacterium]|jgi:predicted transcriptional regulator